MLPDVLPLADAAIVARRTRPASEYYSWMATRFAMKGLFKLADQAIKTPVHGRQLGRLRDEEAQVLQRHQGALPRHLLLSEANHYLAIAEDPPDPNFDRR